MKTYQMIIIVFSAFLLYTLIFYVFKKKKPLKRAFLTSLLGIVFLVSFDVAGVYTGVSLPISPFSLCVSSCLGVPGVCGMLVMFYLT